MSAMGAKAMLFETRFTAVAEKVRAELPQVKSFVVIGGNGPAWASEYEDLLAESSSAEPDVEVEESDPYYYNLTSGTTGLPKAYALTQYNNAFVGPMFEAFDMTSHDVILTVFPAFGRVGFAWIAAGNDWLSFARREGLQGQVQRDAGDHRRRKTERSGLPIESI
jgi:fatty-acyl-CoA synthase